MISVPSILGDRILTFDIIAWSSIDPFRSSEILFPVQLSLHLSVVLLSSFLFSFSAELPLIATANHASSIFTDSGPKLDLYPLRQILS
jgi:hypothetical protein